MARTFLPCSDTTEHPESRWCRTRPLASLEITFRQLVFHCARDVTSTTVTPKSRRRYALSMRILCGVIGRTVTPLASACILESRVDESLITRRSPALLTGIFATVALVLAAVGIYGVLSYAVSQRHREIGVRMALGALPKQVLAQFFSLGMKLLLLGTALGLIGAWAAGRAMHTILFGVGSVQPLVLGATFAVIVLVVLLACLLPAQRAAKVDPMVA